MNASFWNTFLKSNETKYRLLRTIVQGILAVLIANVDLLVSSLTIPPEYKAMFVALVMAVLSPIMSELGKNKDGDNTEEPVVEQQTEFNDDGEDMFEVIDDEDQDESTEE